MISWYVRFAMAAHRTDRWHTVSFVSEALRGNPLGDPHERPLHVWVPEDTSRRYPCVYVIQGMAGMVDAWFNVEPWTLSYPDRIDALAPEAVVVLVDAFTAVGGSQYLDSPAIGSYHTYLCDEIVPYVDAHFPTLADARAPRHPGQVVRRLRRDDHAAAASRPLRWARDPRRRRALRGLLRPRLRAGGARAARQLRRLVRRVLGDFRSGRPVLSSPDDELLVNTYAMCAAYSAA